MYFAEQRRKVYQGICLYHGERQTIQVDGAKERAVLVQSKPVVSDSICATCTVEIVLQDSADDKDAYPHRGSCDVTLSADGREILR